jgi:prepilin-type N-terminal cleavage/methylation domain-containing protein
MQINLKNFMTPNLPRAMQKGFTLFEVLTVMLLISTVGMTIVSIFIVSLRGTSKAAALTLIRQEGNFAISQMSKSIRFANTLDVPDPCDGLTNDITVTSVNGVVTTYTYDPDSDMIFQNGEALFNQSQMAIANATFLCAQQSASDPPTISIQFVLFRQNSGNNADTTASLEFKTTVAMRNWQR